MSAVSLLVDDVELSLGSPESAGPVVELLQELPLELPPWEPTQHTQARPELPELLEREESSACLLCQDELLTGRALEKPPAFDADASVELLSNLLALDILVDQDTEHQPLLSHSRQADTASVSRSPGAGGEVFAPWEGALSDWAAQPEGTAWSDEVLAAAARASSKGRALLEKAAAPSELSAESAGASALQLAGACRVVDHMVS